MRPQRSMARCAEPPQGFGALVLTPNQGAHLVPPCKQEFGEVAADAAHSAGCSGHEDRVVVFMFRRHIADLGLLQKTNSAGTPNEAGCRVEVRPAARSAFASSCRMRTRGRNGAGD